MAYALPIPTLLSCRPRNDSPTRLLPVLLTLSLCVGWFGFSVLKGQEADFPERESIPEKGIVRVNVGDVVTRDMIVLIAGDSLFLPVIESAALFGLTVRTSEAGGTLLLTESGPLFELDGLSANYYDDGRGGPVPSAALYRNDGVSYLEWNFFSSILDVSAAYDPQLLYLRLAPGANLPVIAWARERSIGTIRDLMAREERTDRNAPYYRSMLGLPEFSWRLNHQAVRTNGGTVGNRMAGLIHISGSLLMGQAELGVAGTMNAVANSGPKWGLTHWRWTYSNPSDPLLSLFRIGRIAAADRSAVGVSFSNQALAPRKVHGVFTYSGRAAPGTQVNLIGQNMMTASVVADPAGSYQLHVPVGYGTTSARLRYQSADGIFNEQTIFWTSAAGMIPAGTIDYSANIGITRAGEEGKEVASDLTLRAGISSRWMLSASVSGFLPLEDSAAASRFSRMLAGIHGWIGRSSALFVGIDPRTGMLRARLDLGGPGEPGLTLTADSVRFDGRSDFSAGGWLPVGSMRLAAHVRFLHDADSAWYVVPSGTFGIGLGNTSINLSAYMAGGYLARDHSPVGLAARLDIATYVLQGLPITAGFRWLPDRQTVSDLYLGATAHLRNGRRVGVGALFPTPSFEKAVYTLRLELPIGNVRPVVTATTRSAYSSLSTSLDGTTAITPLGITMLPAGYRGRFSIALTGFDDRNRNGKRDAGERDLGPVDAEVHYDGTTRTAVGGMVEGLPPYRRVRIEIDRFGLVQSGLFPIRSSLLLTTAAGGSMRLEIPFAEGRDVTGAVSVLTSEGLPDPGASSLLSALYVSLADEKGGIFEGEVFSDGTLYFPGVAQGVYSLRFDRRQLEARGLCVADVPEEIDVSDHKSDMPDIALRRCE